MEMIPMMTIPMMSQPQDAASLLPGMAAAGNAQAAQRLSAAPLLFAALLQEMLPPVQAGIETQLNRSLTGKSSIAVPANAVSNPVSGLADADQEQSEQSPEPPESPLAQLLAMAGQPAAGQSPAQPTWQAAGQADGLKDGGLNNSPGTPGEGSGLPEPPPTAISAGSLQYPAAAGVIFQYVNRSPAMGGGSSASVRMPEGAKGAPAIGVAPATVRAELAPGDDTFALMMPWKAASENDSPEGTSAVAEFSTPQQQGRTAGSGGYDILAPQQPSQADDLQAAPGNAAPGGPAPAAVPEKMAATAVAQVLNTLLFQSPASGSGGDDTLAPSQPRQAEGMQAVQAGGGLAQIRAGELLTAPAAKHSRDPVAGPVRNDQAVFGEVQLRTKLPVTMPSSAIQTADAVPAEPVAVITSPMQATEDYAKFSRLGLTFEGGQEVQRLPVIGGIAGIQDNLTVEVVFVDPAAKGGSTSGNGNSESGTKDKGKETITGPGVPAAQTADTPGLNRFALQPKVEEPGKALHESILAQVKASVVSHDGKGNGTITVRLNPAELGDLQVNVRIENQRVMVEVISDNRSVRDALMGNLDTLKETLLKQNLNMERFNVSSGGGNGFSQGFREERGDQRSISSPPFGHEAVPLEIVRENDADDWGGTGNSLVNLRL